MLVAHVRVGVAPHVGGKLAEVAPRRIGFLNKSGISPKYTNNTRILLGIMEQKYRDAPPPAVFTIPEWCEGLKAPTGVVAKNRTMLSLLRHWNRLLAAVRYPALRRVAKRPGVLASSYAHSPKLTKYPAPVPPNHGQKPRNLGFRRNNAKKLVAFAHKTMKWCNPYLNTVLGMHVRRNQRWGAWGGRTEALAGLPAKHLEPSLRGPHCI